MEDSDFSKTLCSLASPIGTVQGQLRFIQLRLLARDDSPIDFIELEDRIANAQKACGLAMEILSDINLDTAHEGLKKDPKPT